MYIYIFRIYTAVYTYKTHNKNNQYLMIFREKRNIFFYFALIKYLHKEISDYFVPRKNILKELY